MTHSLFNNPMSTRVCVTKNTRPLNKANNKCFRKMVTNALKKHVPKAKTYNPAKSHMSHMKIRLANGSVKDLYKIVIVKKVIRR